MPKPTYDIPSKLVGLLALLLALCVNPLTTAYLLTADNRLDSPPVFYSTWVAAILLVLLSNRTLLRHDHLPLPLSRALLAVFAAGLTFYGTLFLDRLAGYLLLPPAHSLILPANSAVRYRTPEFDVTARANSLGFRDYEYPKARNDKFRILVIGDSFTFGWGVDLPDTWVKQLEQKLQAGNQAVEVLNLGRSGGSPETYADIAARAIPVLQPDLVLVAVLQGNDLYQCLSVPAAAPLSARPRQNLWRIALSNAYPNFLRLLHHSVLTADVQPLWQQQAHLIERNLPPVQKQALQRLPPQVLQYFRAGDLNPDLVWDNLRDPDMYLKLEAVQNPAVQKAIRRMSFSLDRIRETGRRHGAQTWLVALPNKYYLCRQGMAEHALTGLRLDTNLVRRNAPDSILAAEAARLRLPLFRPPMQQHCEHKKLYYTYDGHFTATGNHLFAEALFAEINEPLRQLSREKKQK